MRAVHAARPLPEPATGRLPVRAGRRRARALAAGGVLLSPLWWAGPGQAPARAVEQSPPGLITT
ncbi:hypothetical protein, partial [Kitasatospora sp. NPDC059571]|uniref:hypothetical protein n=1 Tax=Kitasatospora sp. NPDC059571 TaxID=3346871 RepID=UPI0036BB6583